MRYQSGKTRIAKGISDSIMQYVSGKTRIAKDISTVINTQHTRPNSVLVSLFCGGLSVETKLAQYFDKIICNDKQEYLIELYKSLQNGWIPPDEITQDEYKYIKEHKDENKALTAFVGFGCSFGGKWFGGYGRHGTKGKHAMERSMCQESKRALLRDIEILKNAEFSCLDYKDVILPEGCVIYADPPYKNKLAGYGLKESFDSDEFWEWCRLNSKTHDIFISELEAPSDFEAIWERKILRQIDNCNNNMFNSTEKLFIYKGE